MRQADLNRAIARATGESVGQIARLGFSLVIVPALFALPHRGKCCTAQARHQGPFPNTVSGLNRRLLG